MNLGAPEILLIMLVILVFFGPKKIPDLARGLGQGLREFRKASREIQDLLFRLKTACAPCRCLMPLLKQLKQAAP